MGGWRTDALPLAATKGQVGEVLREFIGGALARVEACGVEGVGVVPRLRAAVQIPNADEDIGALCHLHNNRPN